MAKEIITLQYILTVEDQITYHKYLMSKDEVIAKTVKKNRMIFTIICIVFAVVGTYWEAKSVEFTPMIIAIIVGAILGYAVSSLLKSIIEKSYMKLVRKKIDESRGNRDIPLEITPLKKGLQVVSPDKPLLVSWESIVDVVETPAQILLFFGPVNAFIIPKKGLDIKGLSDFKVEVEKQCEKFKNRKNLNK